MAEICMCMDLWTGKRKGSYQKVKNTDYAYLNVESVRKVNGDIFVLL